MGPPRPTTTSKASAFSTFRPVVMMRSKARTKPETRGSGHSHGLVPGLDGRGAGLAAHRPLQAEDAPLEPGVPAVQDVEGGAVPQGVVVAPEVLEEPRDAAPRGPAEQVGQVR